MHYKEHVNCLLYNKERINDFFYNDKELLILTISLLS